MKDFFTVASVSPNLKVGDVAYNVEQIKKDLLESVGLGARLVVFPELCLTGYTCGDLFFSEVLLEAAQEGLRDLVSFSADVPAIFCVGLALAKGFRLHNCTAVIYRGKLLGVVPKESISQDVSDPEVLYFHTSSEINYFDELIEKDDFYSGSSHQIFCARHHKYLRFAIDAGNGFSCTSFKGNEYEDAVILLKPCALQEFAGHTEQVKTSLCALSSINTQAIVLSSAGVGESTTDAVYGGYGAIVCDGVVCNERPSFKSNICIAQIDIGSLYAKRLKQNTRRVEHKESDVICQEFNFIEPDEKVWTAVDPTPFTTSVDAKRAEEMVDIQAQALARRMKHVKATKLVIGVSGGLDSTQALLVANRVFEVLNLDKTGIIAISMPGFGTSDRTYSNAKMLCKCLGVTYREISITKAVAQHFEDIHHDPQKADVVYENAQARERTQILMDVANQENTFVLGTGDLSELALGWATYNGDHMSMYGVNASVPKTLVHRLVYHLAEHSDNADVSAILLDICQTPVSPELLPLNSEGVQMQKTEERVGPYVLHDFIIYHALVNNATPKKIFALAVKAFNGTCAQYALAPPEILKWLKVFYTRFFTQQYKRSCMPDGPLVTQVSLSPRKGLLLPSDAQATLWLREIEELEKSLEQTRELTC